MFSSIPQNNNDKEGDNPEDKENNKVIACKPPKTIKSGNCFCYFSQQGLDSFLVGVEFRKSPDNYHSEIA
jgi:hypothetical protein